MEGTADAPHRGRGGAGGEQQRRGRAADPDARWPRAGRAVIRAGQLVEIGGGFRVPDVLKQSGARLVEVGTTNRTHLRDYREALDESVALVMRAHHSNFKMIGFTTEPGWTSWSAGAAGGGRPGLGRAAGHGRFGWAHEPMPQESMAAGRGGLFGRQAGGRAAGRPDRGPARICGAAEATLTMVASSTTISCAVAMTSKARPRCRFAGPVAPAGRPSVTAPLAGGAVPAADVCCDIREVLLSLVQACVSGRASSMTGVRACL